MKKLDTGKRRENQMYLYLIFRNLYSKKSSNISKESSW